MAQSINAGTSILNDKWPKKYYLTNEILNAVTHGIACILSIIGLVLLIFKGLNNHDMVELTSYIIFGASMILLYLFSTVYHSFSFTKARKVLRVFDHSSIFLLIAGSYSPFTLVTLRHQNGWILFALEWLIAFIGIGLKIYGLEKMKKISTLTYIGMGWIAVFAMVPIYQGIGLGGVLWLLAGGLSYTIGTLFYRLKETRYTHVIWHLFVMAGSFCIFMSIYLYV